MKALKKHPQTMLQLGCMVVAIWFLMAELQGENTMPKSIYGNAKDALSPEMWAGSVIFACAVYFTGIIGKRQIVVIAGTALHFSVMVLLTWYCLDATRFTPIAPWTALLTVTLALCLWGNVEELNDA